jgi:hypothetical protein
MIHTNKNTQNLTSPVPAGNRVAFFARPKKVTKEKTFAWRRALLSRPFGGFCGCQHS